jgi:hypothetical protein
VGPADIAGASCEALTGWGVRMRCLSSRLAYDSPQGRRVRVGGGSELEISVLVEKRNFAELAGEFARDYLGKCHEAGLRVGRHGEAEL